MRTFYSATIDFTDEYFSKKDRDTREVFNRLGKIKGVDEICLDHRCWVTTEAIDRVEKIKYQISKILC